jgi:hypothetical protein
MLLKDSVKRIEYNKLYFKKWREKNKEKCILYAKKKYEKNKEKYILNAKEWYKKNKEKKLKQSKEWKEKNKEKCILNSRKWREKNKERCILTAKEWYEKNKENRLKKSKEWSLKNKERHKQLSKNWYQKNKKHIREKNKERYGTDPNFKMRSNISRRILLALKGKCKSANTMNLLGVTNIEFIWNHLEKSFKSGMTRQNHGKWHIDHIIPCISFDLTKPEEQAKCFHYTNLQPLWASENLAKGSKISS